MNFPDYNKLEEKKILEEKKRKVHGDKGQSPFLLDEEIFF